jgi:hypothetical protein
MSTKGYKFTDEQRARLSEVRRGRKLSEAHRAAIARGRTGLKFSAEHRAKIAAGTRQVLADEKARGIKRDYSTPLIGIKRSAETRRRMGEAAKRRWAAGVYEHVDQSAVGKQTWARMPAEVKRRIVIGGRQGKRMTKPERYVKAFLEAS